MSVWIEYFTEGLAAQLREIKELGTEVMKKSILVNQYHLSARQVLAVNEGSLTIQQFEEICPDVTRRTLQRELKVLIEKGLVVKGGDTNKIIYRLKENINQCD